MPAGELCKCQAIFYNSSPHSAHLLSPNFFTGSVCAARREADTGARMANLLIAMHSTGAVLLFSHFPATTTCFPKAKRKNARVMRVGRRLWTLVRVRSAEDIFGWLLCGWCGWRQINDSLFSASRGFAKVSEARFGVTFISPRLIFLGATHRASNSFVTGLNLFLTAGAGALINY